MNTEQPSGSGPQQRRFFRAAVEFPVGVTLSGNGEAIEGSAVDLSGGGMRVITKSDLSAGQNITLRFSLPEAEREMMVRGRVVLSFFDASRQQYAHGVAFTQIAAPDQSEIVEFIHELQQRART
ncbi:MAG TPA: PilZ domain-containing protein [Candidatus Rubrimentiphilum sp.]|nr:PilZ domain-containing protein [Candidatus Rubrimentiphilum sp.]